MHAQHHAQTVFWQGMAYRWRYASATYPIHRPRWLAVSCNPQVHYAGCITAIDDRLCKHPHTLPKDFDDSITHTELRWLDARSSVQHTCTAMRDSSVLTTPFSRMNRVPGLSPAMPYTVKQNTRALTIWKGVVAATLAA